MKNKIKDVKFVLMLYFIIGISAISLFCLLANYIFGNQIDYFFRMLEENGFNYLATLSIQVSVSFIVVSVVTVLSQKNCVIYWQDIMSYKLIDPMFTNFNALASYVFADLLLSIFFVITDSKFIYICFFITVILIMLLSLKMMEVYFSRDKIKIQMANQYAKEREHRKSNQKTLDLYREHKRKVIQYTIQAIDKNDIDVVCENLELLLRNEENDDSVYIIKKMLNEKKVYTISRVAKTNFFIFNKIQYINLFCEICEEILSETNSNNDENIRYVISIYKSMCECYLGENDETKKTLKDAIDNFCQKISESGKIELAEKIKDVCNVHLNYQVLK